ncbi:patatin-like phospholipase RssA [Acidihalobacter ferrooxydans]|uniref:Patatin n=1 Tax=Acidihalobacter ferrooxydans TaxID=1765967 RepID=A0A1P8UHW0_9GAMM|nr:patatin-like phospholipase RssA [Acidihalobacter ferrooxydans]APZ43426.1 patatin [Acidihalobacter ferrooxydans]
MSAARTPRIGLALGSGAARGWAHIGVLRVLRELGIAPDIVCGTSVGALVGAAWVSGAFDEFSAWVGKLTRRQVFSLLDLRLAGGLISGQRLLDALEQLIPDQDIASLDSSYGAVATDLIIGNEVWLREGSLLSATRASMALPGLFAPHVYDGRWLVDGGLVNPVPVSLCRAFGADIVIAVDLNADLLERHRIAHPPAAQQATEFEEGVLDRVSQWFGPFLRDDDAVASPSILEVLGRSINIMSARITRSRMAGDPPELLLAPRLARIGLMDFHRGVEAIADGEKTARESAAALREVCRR